MSRRETTLGEARVGVSFNPSGNATIDEIKARAAGLLDLLHQVDAGVHCDGEVLRVKSVAMTKIEDAAMWAVKAAARVEQARKRANSGSGSQEK